MPELPEVETIRRKLVERLEGRVLQKVQARRADLRYPLPRLWDNILEEKIIAIRRRGKYLIFDFTKNHSLILHLGMSGRLFFTDESAPLDTHDHVLFNFSHGLHLRLRDPRRFGSLHLVETAKLTQHKLIKNLGVEPLSDDFTPLFLWNAFKNSKAPLKTLLMDAHRLVGVGNIYANEALFMAGLSPFRRGLRFSLPQAKKLCQAVQAVLQASLVSGGTSFRDYVDVDSKPGLHKINLLVYDRSGDFCTQCQKPIVLSTKLGRSTYYCPSCQK